MIDFIGVVTGIGILILILSLIKKYTQSLEAYLLNFRARKKWLRNGRKEAIEIQLQRIERRREDIQERQVAYEKSEEKLKALLKKWDMTFSDYGNTTEIKEEAKERYKLLKQFEELALDTSAKVFSENPWGHYQKICREIKQMDNRAEEKEKITSTLNKELQRLEEVKQSKTPI